MLTLRVKGLLLALLVTVGVYAASGPVVTTPAMPVIPEMKWQPVYGTPTKDGFKLMVDSNSLHQLKVGRETISMGDFMITSEKLVTLTVDGKTFKAQSIIKGVAVECKSGVASVIYDMYFDNKSPKNTDTVVAVKEYPEAYFSLTKKSPIYQILCPILA